MNRLKEERKKMHKTQNDIAKKLNITQQAYSVYENETIQPTRNMMISIAKVFGQNVSYLFCLDENFEQTKTELKENKQENLTEEQKILLEKIKALDDMQLKQVSSFVDKVIALDKEQEQMVKILISEKYKNKNDDVN